MIDIKLVWWKIIVEFYMKIIWAPVPNPNNFEADVRLALKLQIPDIVTEIFRLKCEQHKDDPVELAKLQAIMEIFKFLGFIPIFEIKNLEIPEFSYTKFKKNRENMRLILDMTIFSFNIDNTFEFGDADTSDALDPANSNGDKAKSALVALQVTPVMVHALVHKEVCTGRNGAANIW